MPATAREATIEDVSTLAGMMREFCAEARYALDAGRAKPIVSTLLADASHEGIWIVYPDQALAGYVEVTYRFSMEFGGMDALIDELLVRARYRRQGNGEGCAGRSLRRLRSARDSCRACGNVG